MKPLNLTRRKFINKIVKGGLTLPLVGSVFSLIKQNQDINSTNDFASITQESNRPLMIFSNQLEWITNYDELCEFVAELGFNGLELTVRPGGYVLPERVEEDLPLIVEAAENAGINIIMIATHITSPEDQYAEQILRTASTLGIKFYRMGGLNYTRSKPIEQTLEEYKFILRDLADMNQEYRIHGAYQTHAGGNRIGASVWDLWFLLNDLDPRWIGCMYDTRHTQVEGGEWWSIGLRLLQPYIKTTVVKDFRWIQDGSQRRVQNCPIGEGVVDFDTYFEWVRELNITGPISLHFPFRPLLEGIDEKNKIERVEDMKEFMISKGIMPLRTMLKQAGLS